MTPSTLSKRFLHSCFSLLMIAAMLSSAAHPSSAKQQESRPPSEQETGDALRQMLTSYINAVLTGKVSGDKMDRAVTLLLLGMTYSLEGKKQAAVNSLNEAVSLMEGLEDKTLQGIGLAAIGAIYAAMGFHNKSIEFINRAVPILESSNQRLYLAASLSTLGAVYFQLQERRKGLEYLNRALTLFQAVGVQSYVVLTLDAIASINSAMGEYKKALDLYTQALSVQKALKDPYLEAKTIIGIGNVYDNMGQGEKALEYFHKAVDICRTANDRAQEADALNKLGSIYHHKGERERALEYFNRALQAAPANNRAVESAVLMSTGAFYHQSGDLYKALQLYNKALAISMSLEDLQGKATCLAYIAIIYNTLGEFQTALHYNAEALAAFRLIEHRSAEADTLLTLGYTHASLGEIDKALEYLNEALGIHRSIGNPQGEARVLQLIGELHGLLGDNQKALSNYDLALKIMRRVEDRYGEGATLGRIGRVYRALRDDQKALSYLSQSLTITQSVEDRFNEASILSDIGFLYENKGEMKTALDFYRQSIDRRESIRAGNRLEEFKIGLASKDAGIYNRAILLEMRDVKASRAFDLIERARSRAFLDQLGNVRPDTRKKASPELILEEQALASELASLEEKIRKESSLPYPSSNSALILSLENQLTAGRRRYENLLTRIKVSNPEYASLTSVSTLTLSEIQKLLGKETTLLSYFVTPYKTLAFIVSKTDFRAIEIPVREADLISEITWFRSFPSLRGSHHESLNRLHSWLIAPVKQYIKTPLVGIVPHGVLHYLPFAALTDGEHYLGNHTLYFLPSASVLPFIQKKSKPVGTRVMALSQSHAQGLPALAHVDKEAKVVGDLFNTQALTTGSALKSDFLKEAGDYSILHIAAHSELNTSNPLFSRIILGGGEETGSALEVREVYDLDLSKASLVVLSACNTHLGGHSKGDDIVGLNRAFIYAGAPTIIASLWTVDDESTSYLMREFYSRLKSGRGKAEALREAQSKTRKKYPHPYYWAGFVLSGDPGPTHR